MKRGVTRRKRGPSQANGLRNFAMHSGDEASRPALRQLQQERASVASFGGPAAGLGEMDAETAATRILEQVLASKAVPSLTTPTADGVKGEFARLGTQRVPLTDTTVVKFRQTFNKIPVYGSLVSVELDNQNGLVSLNSSLAEPKGVPAVAKISPAEAVSRVQKHVGYQKRLDKIVPRLSYYFDRVASKWRLVYILEDVPVSTAKRAQAPVRLSPHYMDYVVDARTGSVVAELPRTPSIAANESAEDGLKKDRQITVEADGAKKVLRDGQRNVATFDFRFGDPQAQESRLPGRPIGNPPSPWPPAAVSAHANAEAVAEFLQQVLKRNNIDDHGGSMNASINCVVARESPDGRQWFNAFWNGDQMVYGQRKDGAGLMSLAVDLDVVGHEMFHGVTDFTARLEYANQSGALNESYSDIFGVVIANFAKADTDTWNWKIGEGLSPDGKPFRDMQDPTRFGQPGHMKDFQVLPNTDNGDWGGVHVNSGIHNRAAYLILTAKDAAGKTVLQPRDVAAVFYLALTQHLSRTSQFSDSRRSVLLAARTLFRNQSKEDQDTKVNAIAQAFTAVGIA